MKNTANNTVTNNAKQGFWGKLVAEYTEVRQQPAYLLSFVLTVGFIPAMSLWVPHFLAYIQARPGVQLNDLVLNLIPPIDVSTPLFAVCYISIVLAILLAMPNAKNFLIGLQAYVLVTSMRMLTIYLVPLEAPAGYVDLTDPFMAIFVYAGNPITKDLFFSGHTSTMVILWLMVPQKKLKPLFGLAAITVGILVMVQHVHYFIDVVAAPFFTLLAYSIVVTLHNTNLNLQTGVLQIYKNEYQISFLQKTLKN